MSEPREEIALPVTALDRGLETSAAFGLALLVAGTVLALPLLPGRVPVHFGIGGAPDRWSGPGSVLLLPAVAAALYALFGALLKISPRQYNSASPTTERDRERQWLLGRRLILTFRLYVVVLFLALFVGKTLVAFGVVPGLSWWPAAVSLSVPLVVLLVYFRAASTERNAALTVPEPRR